MSTQTMTCICTWCQCLCPRAYKIWNGKISNM